MTTRLRFPTITSTYTPTGNEVVGEVAFNTDTDKQVEWNGSAWVNLSSGGGGATDLDDLTDVTVTTPSATEILQYNGTAWVNAPAPSGTYSDEQALDYVGAAMTDSASINFTFDDVANTITAVAIFGTGAGTVCEGNDSRLTDARTPSAHATSHKSGGSDAVKLDELAAPTDVTTLNATTGAHGLLPKLSGNAAEYLNGVGGYTTPAGGGDVVGPSGGTVDQELAVYTSATGKGIGKTTVGYTLGTINDGQMVVRSGTALVGQNVPSGVGGDVVGPGTATDNAIARYDSTTGKLLQNSAVTLSDAGSMAGATIPAASNTIVPNVAVTTSAVVTLVLGQALTMRPSAGSTSVTLPAAPAAGGWCTVMNKAGASRNVLAAGSDTITLTDGTTGETQAPVADGELAVFTCAAGETIWEQQ